LPTVTLRRQHRLHLSRQHRHRSNQ